MGDNYFPALVRFFFTFCFLYACQGCSIYSPRPFQQLEGIKNQGVIPFDSNNPFLAVSQFLTDAPAKDEVLSGFLNRQGMPVAISFTDRDSLDGKRGSFTFYSNNHRYDVQTVGGMTTIAGPFSDKSFVANIAVPAATPRTTTTTTSSKQPPTANTLPQIPVERTIPTPKATATLATAKILNAKKVKSATALPSVPPPPLSSPTPSGDLAEITARGDLVHYVTFPGETLSILSRWYTNDRDNAGKISRLNQMKNANALEIGDTVIIPSYMLKNRTRLSAEGLDKIKATIAKHN